LIIHLWRGKPFFCYLLNKILKTVQQNVEEKKDIAMHDRMKNSREEETGNQKCLNDGGNRGQIT